MKQCAAQVLFSIFFTFSSTILFSSEFDKTIIIQHSLLYEKPVKPDTLADSIMNTFVHNPTMLIGRFALKSVEKRTTLKNAGELAAQRYLGFYNILSEVNKTMKELAARPLNDKEMIGVIKKATSFTPAIPQSTVQLLQKIKEDDIGLVWATDLDLIEFKHTCAALEKNSHFVPSRIFNAAITVPFIQELASSPKINIPFKKMYQSHQATRTEYVKIIDTIKGNSSQTYWFIDSAWFENLQTTNSLPSGINIKTIFSHQELMAQLSVLHASLKPIKDMDGID